MFLLVRVRHAEVGVDAGDLQDAVLIHPPDGVQVLRQESDAVHTLSLIHIFGSTMSTPVDSVKPLAA